MLASPHKGERMKMRFVPHPSSGLRETPDATFPPREGSRLRAGRGTRDSEIIHGTRERNDSLASLLGKAVS